MASAAETNTGVGGAAEFDLMLTDILAHPERLEGLSGDELRELHRKMDPFGGIGGPAPDPKNEHVRTAAISGINMREDYIRRFTMTGLVGFICQLCEEWEVPEAQRVWVPETKLAPEATAPPTPSRLVTQIRAALDIALESEAAAKEAEKLKQEALEDDAALPAGGDATLIREKMKAASSAEAKSAGLLYAAMHGMHRNSIDMSNRLRETALAASKYPAVQQVLNRYPLPPAPGQVTFPAPNAKAIIHKFLMHWLAFDPSVHARAGHNAKAISEAIEKVQIGESKVDVDSKDPGHLTVSVLRANPVKPTKFKHMVALDKILESERTKAAALAMLNDHALLNATLLAVDEERDFKHYLCPVGGDLAVAKAAAIIPPQDTFHRWNYYMEVNHDKLRTITEALYPERADLEWAFGLWEVFDGTREQVDEKFNQHCQKYSDQCRSTIRHIGFGGWVLQADFAENRKKIEFYNKHTEVLKRILDRHTDDRKTGADLMRNRVTQMKAANIAADGPDAPGLNRYKREVASRGQDLASKGVQQVISREAMLRLEKAKGDVKAAQELELLDQHEATVKRLTELKTLRPLTREEVVELEEAERVLPSVREMVNVPEDAIQVDVFSSDPKSGEFGKTHFYTKAFAPDEDQKTSEQPTHPALRANLPQNFVSPAQKPGQQLAPFAVEHMLTELAPQSEAAQKQAALRDAEGKAQPPVVIHAPAEQT